MGLLPKGLPFRHGPCLSLTLALPPSAPWSQSLSKSPKSFPGAKEGLLWASCLWDT